MKLSTAVINTIEMTQEEESVLWHTSYDKRVVCGKKVIRWNTSDGNNEMLLEGDTSYRVICIK